tara:strand:+ start:139 stop:444 length:306 start_codon:yes stop_codon:yes gene_type:complete
MSDKKISAIQILLYQAFFIIAYIAGGILISLFVYFAFLFTEYAILELLMPLSLPIDAEMTSKVISSALIAYSIGRNSIATRKQLTEYWKAIVDIKTINSEA